MRGVRYHDLIRWSANLKKSKKESLIAIVNKRRYWLEQAKNLGGALHSLVQAALAGKKIREWGDWGTADQSAQCAPNPLIKKYKNQTYEIPATGAIIKVDDRGGVVLVPADIRAPHEHRTLAWLDTGVQSGAILPKPGDPGGDGGDGDDPDPDPLAALAGIKAKLWPRANKGRRQ